jgi:hypothetical protein
MRSLLNKKGRRLIPCPSQQVLGDIWGVFVSHSNDWALAEHGNELD